MGRILRCLAAVGSLGLLSLLPIQASALGAGFQATVSPNCVAAGQNLSISIPSLTSGAVVAVRVSFQTAGNATAAVYASGPANSQGTYTTSIKIPSTAVAGSGSVAILVAGNNIDEFGSTGITIGGTGGCPSPGATTINGQGEIAASVYTVAKTCPTGVSGSAVFSLSYGFNEGGLFQLPDLTVPCNGSAAMPPLAANTTLTIHEKTPPTNGVAAADVSLSIPPASTTITIHNTAAVTATPTPSARVLPRTGSAPLPGSMALAWMSMMAGGAVLFAAGMALRRRTH